MAGMDAFLPKPLRKADLIAHVTALCEAVPPRAAEESSADEERVG